jgi:hypothetical protein
MVLALRITLKHIKKNEHEVTETLFTIITDAGYAFPSSAKQSTF